CGSRFRRRFLPIFRSRRWLIHRAFDCTSQLIARIGWWRLPSDRRSVRNGAAGSGRSASASGTLTLGDRLGLHRTWASSFRGRFFCQLVLEGQLGLASDLLHRRRFLIEGAQEIRCAAGALRAGQVFPYHHAEHKDGARHHDPTDQQTDDLLAVQRQFVFFLDSVAVAHWVPASTLPALWRSVTATKTYAPPDRASNSRRPTQLLLFPTHGVPLLAGWAAKKMLRKLLPAAGAAKSQRRLSQGRQDLAVVGAQLLRTILAQQQSSERLARLPELRPAFDHPAKVLQRCLGGSSFPIEQCQRQLEGRRARTAHRHPV